MKIKEISIFKERKVNIGNYETVGLSVGMVVETSTANYDNDYQDAEAILDAKLEYFVDKWKNPKKIADKMAKENLNKYNSELGF